MSVSLTISALPVEIQQQFAHISILPGMCGTITVCHGWSTYARPSANIALKILPDKMVPQVKIPKILSGICTHPLGDFQGSFNGNYQGSYAVIFILDGTYSRYIKLEVCEDREILIDPEPSIWVYHGNHNILLLPLLSAIRIIHFECLVNICR